MSVQCPRPFTGSQLSVSQIEQLRRYARSLEIRTSTGAGIRTERGPDGTRLAVDRRPGGGAAAEEHSFRCVLSSRAAVGEETESQPVFRIAMGRIRRMFGSNDLFFPVHLETVLDEDESYEEDANNVYWLQRDIPEGVSAGYAYLCFILGESATLGVKMYLWMTGEGGRPIPEARLTSPTNSFRAVMLFRWKNDSGSIKVFQHVTSDVDLPIPVASDDGAGTLLKQAPVRATATAGQEVYLWDAETEAYTLQEAVGGEVYFDVDGNPVFSANHAVVVDYLRFSDAAGPTED